jgi:hypothetical protein
MSTVLVFQVVELQIKYRQHKKSSKTMDKQLKSMQKTHKLQEILNVKNHKIFNCSKLTIVHEWLLKQRGLKKVECQVILYIERGFSEKCPLSQ